MDSLPSIAFYKAIAFKKIRSAISQTHTSNGNSITSTYIDKTAPGEQSQNNNKKAPGNMGYNTIPKHNGIFVTIVNALPQPQAPSELQAQVYVACTPGSKSAPDHQTTHNQKKGMVQSHSDSFMK
ncbi:MAG: hypothetical protein MI742_03770 [Desulfobacterales bacterium]|nr:hypothetical protein [Desulfobacterales bacterium]